MPEILRLLERTVRLDGRLFPVIGVTEPEFFGVEIGHRFDVAVPVCSDPMFWEAGKGRIPTQAAWWLSLMGRLKPGWTIQRANAQIQTLSPATARDAGLAAATPYRADMAKGYLTNKLTVISGATGVSGLRQQYEDPLWILLATTGLVLLIACANLANLLLARASVREREIAIRQAIGASRGRLIGQLLSESMLLALFAGAPFWALVFAALLSRGLVAFLTTEDNRMFVGLGIDWRVLGFAAGMAVVTCLLFGLAPALRATQVAPASVMRAGGRGTTAGRERFTLRRALVVAQVAMSVMLLAGALLFVRSLQKLLSVDPGFRPEGIVAVSVDYRAATYPKDRITEVRRQMLEKLRERTGAMSAGQVGMTPVSGSGWDQNVWAEGSASPPVDALFNRAGPGYFRTMGTSFVAGRDFEEHDNLTAPKVAIVNEEFARKIFHGQNPVGRIFRRQESADKPDSTVLQVVGLVHNTKYYELREDFRPIAFVAADQDEEPGPGGTFVLRTNAPLGEFYHNAEAAVAEIHPGLGMDFTVLTTQIKDSLMRDRLMAALAGAFGVLAGYSGRAGIIRSDCLYGGAKTQRNRCAGRAWGKRRQCHRTSAEGGSSAAGNRAHRGHGIGGMGRASGGLAGFWTKAERSGDARRGSRAAVDGGPVGKLWASPASVAPATHGCPAGRVNRIPGRHSEKPNVSPAQCVYSRMRAALMHFVLFMPAMADTCWRCEVRETRAEARRETRYALAEARRARHEAYRENRELRIEARRETRQSLAEARRYARSVRRRYSYN